jgi:hypothetical protein
MVETGPRHLRYKVLKSFSRTVPLPMILVRHAIFREKTVLFLLEQRSPGDYQIVVALLAEKSA